MKMRRALLVLSVLSLILAGVMGVIWAVSGSHPAHVAFNLFASRYEFSTHSGELWFTHQQTFTDMVSSKTVNYPLQRIVFALLLVPVLAGLIEVRRRLPRPGRRGITKSDRPLGKVR